MADREAKERKLVALMVNDLGPGLGKQELTRLQEEVRALPLSRLDETLGERLDLPDPADEEALDRALRHVEELPTGDPKRLPSVPDMSHEPRPEEREG
jgi:hypothetical protein